MKKTTLILINALHKLAEPKNIRIMMFILPVVLSIGFGGNSLLDVGGNPGGCTGG